MKSRKSMNLLAFDLDLASLTVNLEALLILWLMDSFSLSQLLALAAVVGLATGRSLKAPSSSRRSS